MNNIELSEAIINHPEKIDSLCKSMKCNLMDTVKKEYMFDLYRKNRPFHLTDNKCIKGYDDKKQRTIYFNDILFANENDSIVVVFHYNKIDSVWNLYRIAVDHIKGFKSELYY
jgi:hypothetical protein